MGREGGSLEKYLGGRGVVRGWDGVGALFGGLTDP